MFSDMIMTEYHRHQLISHRVILVQDMIATDVIIILQERRVLTPIEADRIRQVRLFHRQNEVLLDCLDRKPDSAFDEFCGALLESGQLHLARQLMERGYVSEK